MHCTRERQFSQHAHAAAPNVVQALTGDMFAVRCDGAEVLRAWEA